MQTRFEFLIRRPADEVHADLANPDRFTALHPLIYRMEPIGPNRFRVFEKVRAFYLPVPFSYPATFRADAETLSLHVEAVVAGAVTIVMDIVVIPQSGQCVLQETLHIRTAWPIKTFLSRLIRQQHAILCKNIEIIPASG